MGSSVADVSRRTFDASKGYRKVEIKKGVPLFDADLNELQDNQAWIFGRALDTVIGFDTDQATTGAAYYDLVQVVNPGLAWPSSAPTVVDTPTVWFPGSMRPYVHTGGLSNDFNVMWGPCWVRGLFVEDNEQRGPAARYSATSHVITTGVVSALPGGTTFEDSSKNFLPAAGSLHLTAPSAGVGNGTDRHARVRFLTGDEAGNVYTISAVPTSTRLTVTGPYTDGGPAIGDEYAVIPNAIVFVNAQVENVWLMVWQEDIDGQEDGDLIEPTSLIEASHRQRVRYAMRVFRDGATDPTTTARPSHATVAPQTHDNRVYWELVATITPGGGAPTIVPANIVFNTPKHWELAPLGPILAALKSKLNLATGEFKDIKFQNDIGPGATLTENQHALIHTGTQGVRLSGASNNDLSRIVDIDYWTGAAALPFWDVAGWKTTRIASGWGSAMFANAIIGSPPQAADDGILKLSATTVPVTTSLAQADTPSTGAAARLALRADATPATATAISSAFLQASVSEDGASFGDLFFGVEPNDGSNSAHEVRFGGSLLAGPGAANYAYMVDIENATGWGANVFSGMRIAGPAGTGTHSVLGVTALQVVAGDVIFGSIGAPTFFFDDSANTFLLDGGVHVGDALQVDDILTVNSTLSALGNFACLGTGFFSGLLTLNGGAVLGSADGIAFSATRYRRRRYYMDEFQALGPSSKFYNVWVIAGVVPTPAAALTSAVANGSDAWPVAQFDATGSSPVYGDFKVELNQNETLDQVILSVGSTNGNWDLLVYRIDSSGSLVLVSTNLAVVAVSVGAGLKFVTINLTAPYLNTDASPSVLEHALLRVKFHGSTAENLFAITTRCQVSNIQSSIGIAES